VKTSEQWVEYFKENLQVKRIDWNLSASISEKEIPVVLKSLQAWQLGETSDGKHLLKASKKYAAKIDDGFYVKAVELFIKEEQKHGNNLGRYLDMINCPRIRTNWGDTLFRKIRYFNSSMELWTIAVITVESAAQIFYQSLKDATNCKLLKQICTDILVDEAHHIQFQRERLSIIFQSKTTLGRTFSYQFYKFFFLTTSLVVWIAHKKLFTAGGNDFKKYFIKMKNKSAKIIGRLKPDLNEIHASGNLKNIF
jgi:rubrerythrin